MLLIAGGVLGELHLKFPSQNCDLISLGDFLFADQHSSLHSFTCVFVPWYPGGVGVVGAAAMDEGTAVCLLQESGALVIYDFDADKTVSVGSIGNFDRNYFVLLTRASEVCIQFAKEGGERTVLQFLLTHALKPD